MQVLLHSIVTFFYSRFMFSYLKFFEVLFYAVLQKMICRCIIFDDTEYKFPFWTKLAYSWIVFMKILYLHLTLDLASSRSSLFFVLLKWVVISSIR